MRGGRTWWYVFAIAFVATALAESFLPAQSHPSSAPRRWTSNAILLVVSSLLVVCAYQFTGIALACALRGGSHGLLNRVSVPYDARFAIGFAVLDLAAYFSHRVFHALSPLWRIHRVHHSETDLDLTTGLRFHPAEALLVQGLFLAVIAVLGVPPAAVAFAALAVVVQDFFTHANIMIPEPLDRALRVLIVTPAMHRVHHSEDVTGQGANFGTIFSWWDRVFRTYSVGAPRTGSAPRYGLAEMSNGSTLNGVRLLLMPFRRVRASGPQRDAATESRGAEDSLA
jgi:sterol desaturase/sphingolipid hydroxylase (fatty acid hydroxylase superfamily)